MSHHDHDGLFIYCWTLDLLALFYSQQHDEWHPITPHARRPPRRITIIIINNKRTQFGNVRRGKHTHTYTISYMIHT
jgi:hypothetical protein